MMEAERALIAGLRLKWQWFGTPRGDGGHPDDGERQVGLWVVDDPDALLDQITQEEFDRDDERMPYFGAIWPSAESLAARVLGGPRLDGSHVLDLGCGLGLCGLAAATMGAHVTFFDWEARALEIVAASTEAQDGVADRCDFVIGDWRAPPPLGPFDLILGADVLYERRNGPAVAAFLANHMRLGAEAWISDPGRPQAQQFPALAQAAGLELLSCELLPPAPHRLDITLLRLRRPE